MAREAVAWLERHRHRPLFLNYWAFSVHAPFDAKAELVAKHRARGDPRQPQRSPTYAAMVESLDDAVGFVLSAWGVVAAAADLPRFHVPGCEAEMETLHRLHALHHDGAFSACTLWDGWLPQATLWASAEKRAQYRAALLAKRIDDGGYVSMQQHRGMAHSAGWPFPAWQQSAGAGFHFAVAGDPWAVQMFGLAPLANTDGWEIDGAEVLGIDPAVGLRLRATGDHVTIVAPPFRCGTIVAPFARVEWGGRGLGAGARAGMARPDQAAAILDWIDGRRDVAGDTSRRADIYHWRFGPRSTTKRSVVPRGAGGRGLPHVLRHAGARHAAGGWDRRRSRPRRGVPRERARTAGDAPGVPRVPRHRDRLRDPPAPPARLAGADGLRDPLPRSAAHRHRPRRRARRRRRHGRGRRWCGPLTPFTGACAR